MSARTTLPLLTFLFLVPLVPACDRSSAATTSSTTVASASATPSAVASTAPSAKPAGSPAATAASPTRTFHSYQGKIGQTDFRIVLERTGDKLEGIATR